MTPDWALEAEQLRREKQEQLEDLAWARALLVRLTHSTQVLEREMEP